MHPLRRTSLADAAQGGVYWSMQTENGWMRPSYLNTGAAARVHLAPTGLPRLLPAEDGSVHAAWVLRNLDGNEVWHARLPPPLSNAP
jgi:hypothetical protein